jgi:hypothetical protein
VIREEKEFSEEKIGYVGQASNLPSSKSQLGKLRHPLPANPQMDNLFERASLARILQDHRANPFTFQAPSRQKSPDLNLHQAHLMI